MVPSAWPLPMYHWGSLVAIQWFHDDDDLLVWPDSSGSVAGTGATLQHPLFFASTTPKCNAEIMHSPAQSARGDAVSRHCWRCEKKLQLHLDATNHSIKMLIFQSKTSVSSWVWRFSRFGIWTTAKSGNGLNIISYQDVVSLQLKYS